MGTRSILFTCMGTRGDVQPFCALGQHLADRGWHVTIAAPAEFQEFVGNFKGLDFADIGRSVQVSCCAQFDERCRAVRQTRKVFFHLWSRPRIDCYGAERSDGDPGGPGHANGDWNEDIQGCPSLFQ